MTAKSVSVALFTFLTCCGFLEKRGRIVGTISYYGDPVQVVLPDSVTRGETFEVEVITYGDGCVMEGDTEVEIKGSKATITPYDYDTSVPDIPCSQPLFQYSHTASLRFDEAGKAQIRVLGTEKDLNNQSGTTITVTRTVVVR